MEGLLIPIVGIVSAATVIGMGMWFRHKNRESMQQTFRAALDKGQELSAEMIDRLGSPKPRKDKDLRIGTIWLSLAIALSCFGFAIPDDEANTVMMGIASFPFFIGLAYLILHKFSDKE